MKSGLLVPSPAQRSHPPLQPPLLEAQMVPVPKVRVNDVHSTWVGWEVCGVVGGMPPIGSNKATVVEKASVASMGAHTSVNFWVQYNIPFVVVDLVWNCCGAGSNSAFEGVAISTDCSGMIDGVDACSDCVIPIEGCAMVCSGAKPLGARHVDVQGFQSGPGVFCVKRLIRFSCQHLQALEWEILDSGLYLLGKLQELDPGSSSHDYGNGTYRRVCQVQ
ncbi:hypothetical protein UY3_04139 [Chelonia mydas]|uniref:Uncharacterized protein n=1 Tax=Chelonia mydas TaxID=8469 RepID=M7C2M6_CHEMY|nr:hypothetical protein UY3_04139 [Chelonia mydas]